MSPAGAQRRRPLRRPARRFVQHPQRRGGPAKIPPLSSPRTLPTRYSQHDIQSFIPQQRIARRGHWPQRALRPRRHNAPPTTRSGSLLAPPAPESLQSIGSSSRQSLGLNATGEGSSRRSSLLQPYRQSSSSAAPAAPSAPSGSWSARLRELTGNSVPVNHEYGHESVQEPASRANSGNSVPANNEYGHESMPEPASRASSGNSGKANRDASRIHINTPATGATWAEKADIDFYRMRNDIPEDEPITQDTYDAGKERVASLIVAGDSEFLNAMVHYGGQTWWWHVTQDEYKERMAKLRGSGEKGSTSST